LQQLGRVELWNRPIALVLFGLAALSLVAAIRGWTGARRASRTRSDDGSAISANVGVNPSLTICALAERAMTFVPPKHKTVRDNERTAQGQPTTNSASL